MCDMNYRKKNTTKGKQKMEPDYTIIETAWGDQDTMIHIRRDGEEFRAAAQALGDFMNTLNLPADKHNRLVELAIAQIDAAEESAFKQGFVLGVEYGRYEASETGFSGPKERGDT